ncbi:MAG: minor extracellular serine protease Vpr [Gaiellales bacterium]|nr:minor extracellular serine protease Vpr [Gaiellales bacterium]
MRALFVVLGALPAISAAPALGASARAEVVVELTGAAISQRTPVAQLRDAQGHVDLHRMGPRLALAELAREQRAAVARLQRAAPGLRVRGRLTTVLDGLDVTLPRSELSRLSSVPGVARVWPAVSYRSQAVQMSLSALGSLEPQTDRVPTVVGAPALWSGLGGAAAVGDGIRIGVIDDGIDMTRPSFSGTGYHYPPGFPKGLRASTNGKIIVARAFAPPGGPARMRTAFDPDGSEHGTHVAGIAAGLSGITGTSLGVTISGLSGVAPHAYLGSYRVLTTPTPSFGLNGNGPEIARAIDKAVADGMDVLNLSLGEPEVEATHDLVVRAIHGAAKAGVVTVVAAGNAGDDLGGGSVSSPGSAPDAITVAATSVGRFVGIKLGVLGPGAVPADLASFGAATDAPNQIPAAWKSGVTLVVSGTCGGGRAGALVLVQLGPGCTSTHADAAIAPGALGIVYAQRGAGDPTSVADDQQRSLTVSDLVGARLAQQATTTAGELTLSVDDVPGEQVSANSGLIASFSSRGPAPYSLALKPDVSAPGVDIVSAIPGGYGTWSGTSMASPAVAGAAALLHQRHPGWTPAQIKSALVLTARPVFNDTAHKHPTSVLAAGGGMIDVQAADAPGLFAEPSGISFGLLRPNHGETRTLELRDAGGGAGTWAVSARGLDAPASVDMPAGGAQKIELSLRPPPRSSTGNRSGNIVLTSGTQTLHIRWWGYVERPRLAKAHSRRLTAGGWHTGDTRDGATLVSHYRWPAGPAGSGLPRAYPGREQLWSFTVPRGARNAGVEADGAVVPQILLARDENRLAGEPALPSVGNPYLETYGRFERVSGLLVPAPGRYFVVVETRPGHRPGPYRLRLWINDRTPPRISAVTSHIASGTDTLRFHVSDAGSGISPGDVIANVDGTQEVVSVSAGGDGRVRVSGLRAGRHRLVITASDLQETKNSENAAALALPNTRTAHVTFTVGATG